MSPLAAASAVVFVYGVLAVLGMLALPAFARCARVRPEGLSTRVLSVLLWPAILLILVVLWRTEGRPDTAPPASPPAGGAR